MNDVKAITDEWRHMERLAIEAEGQFHSALAAYHRGVSRVPPRLKAADTARELRRIADPSTGNSTRRWMLRSGARRWL